MGYTLDDGYVKPSNAPNPITDAFINASSRYMYLDVTDTILKMIATKNLPDTISFVLQGICTSNNGPNGITPIGNTGYTYFSREFTNTGGNTVDSLKPTMLIYASNQSILQTNPTPLSVQLINNRTAKLDWIVNVEQNIDHYNIEKGTDGTNFNTIATISAQNDGNETVHYTFTDTSVAQGINYYRWNAIGSYDGLNFNSNTVQVNNIINKINIYKTNDVIVKIYPNPVSSGTYFTLQTTTLTPGKVEVEIIDMQGNVVRAMTETLEGTSFLQIPTTELSKGIYLLGVTNGNTKQYVKVVIQ